MTRTVSSLTSVKKRRKRSVEGTSKSKEIEKKLLVSPTNESFGNTHADSRLPTLIDSHPRLIQALLFSSLSI